MRSRLPRIALAVVAAGLIAWFAVLVRDARIGDAAALRPLHRPPKDEAKLAHELDQLRRAELLNPGTGRQLDRASVLLFVDKRKALRLATSVVHREPDNLDGWVSVYQASLGRDPRWATRASREMRRLNPLGG